MRTVCLAEPSDELRHQLETHLSGRGYSVRSYPSGTDAWEGILLCHPDLFIVSHELDGLSGLDLLALVNGASLKLPTILMTAGGSEGLAADALNLGASCYLVKGPLDRMLGALDSALDRSCHLLDLEQENASLIDELQQKNDDLEAEVERQTAHLSEAYEDLQGLDKMKSAFITLMSHEIRTPLTSILGFSELISQGFCDEIEEQRQLAEEIRNAGRQLCSFVDDLMEYFQWFSGKEEICIAPMRIDRVIRSAEDLVAERQSLKQVKIEVEQVGSPELDGDELALVKVLQRVLDNAVKFSDAGGTVQVRIGGDEDTCQVDVIDRGLGVDPERRDALFRPLEIAGDL